MIYIICQHITHIKRINYILNPYVLYLICIVLSYVFCYTQTTKFEEREMSGKVTSIKFDDKTADLLEELKEHYGASSKAEVIRKSVALLSLAASADGDGKKKKARLLIQGENENGEEYEKEIIVS